MKCVATALSVAFLLIMSGCQVQVGPEVLSPTEDGIVIGDSVKFIFRSMIEPDAYKIYLDEEEIAPKWQREAYPNRWISTIELPSKGPHVLRLESGLENPETVKTVSFRNDLAGSIEAVDLNLSHVLNLNEPEDLAWNWTSAIFLYPLARIAEHSEHGEQYLDYIKTVELNAAGSIDHLGDSLESIFYPSSIWVDSLMMWVLIAMQVGMETGPFSCWLKSCPENGSDSHPQAEPLFVKVAALLPIVGCIYTLNTTCPAPIIGMRLKPFILYTDISSVLRFLLRLRDRIE